MDGIVGQHDDHMYRPVLADVSSVPIDEIINSVNPMLARSIRLVLDDLENPDDAISGWQSFIE